MSRFECPHVTDFDAAMQNKGYRVFDSKSGHDLNIAGIRDSASRANRFDDWTTISYWFDESRNLFAFPGITDPGSSCGEYPPGEPSARFNTDGHVEQRVPGTGKLRIHD